MKKMILTAMVVLGLAVAAQQTAHAGVYVRVGGYGYAGGYYPAAYPVACAPAYSYPCAAPVCPPPAPVVYAPAPVCAPAPVYYAPRPAYYSPASVVVALPGVRIHVGHVHIWF